MTQLPQVSLAAAALASLACVAAVSAAFLPTTGHPPMSDYIGAIAVPIAWVVALFGLGSAIISRHSMPRRRYSLALAGNIAALVAGCAIWLLWRALRTG